VVPEDYREFFAALDSVAGALIGLLFVAVSLAPRRLRDPGTMHLAQAQATTALLVFTNTLTLGLLALFPGIDLAIPTLIVAGLAMLYSLSLARVAFARAVVDRAAVWTVRRLAFGAIAVAGCQVWAGLRIAIHPHHVAGIDTLAGTLVGAVLFGISRAWELVGLQGTSLFRSLKLLHDPAAAARVPGPEDPM
jgi:hypothetical protein